MLSAPPLREFLDQHADEIGSTLRAWCAHRALPSWLSPDDVVHEALARMGQEYDQLYDEQAAVAYAIVCGYRYAIDQGRKEKRRAHPGWRRLVALHASDTSSAEDQALTRLDRKRLSSALSILTPRERLAVELRYAENLPRKEVAALMELSETAVKGVLQRATGKLRNEFGAQPALVPAAWLVRFRRPVLAVLAPRLLVAVFGLAVVSVPAPMDTAPHREAYSTPLPPAPLELPALRPPRPTTAAGKAPTRLTGEAVRAVDAAPRPYRPGGKQLPVKAGLRLTDDGQLGWTGGDEVCAQTGTGQEPVRPCANQTVVGVCPALDRFGLLYQPYTTCERHSEPLYEPHPSS